MDFSGISRDSLIGRVLRTPLRLVPASAVLPILQGPLRGHRWIVGAGTHGCWLGSYEYSKQRLFAAAAKPGAVVYDVGANVGFYSLLAARRAGPAGTVVAFEPLLRNLLFLRRHLELNRVANVDVVEAAVSESTGLQSFSTEHHASMGRLATDGALQVRTVSLDDVVFKDGRPRPHLIKMDIEGGEAAALRGGRRVLEECRPTLFLATHGWEQHQACCELLRQLAYELAAIDGRPLDESDEIMARPRGR